MKSSRRAILATAALITLLFAPAAQANTLVATSPIAGSTLKAGPSAITITTEFPLIEEGNDVYYAAFSACQQSVLKDFPSDILITEVKAATLVLGIKKENLILFDYDVRTFNYRRQDILDDLIKLRTEINPDIVFIPALTDIHQDHKTIAEEGLRAFKSKPPFPKNNPKTIRT